jgi:hypothetical protein
MIASRGVERSEVLPGLVGIACRSRSPRSGGLVHGRGGLLAGQVMALDSAGFAGSPGRRALMSCSWTGGAVEVLQELGAGRLGRAGGAGQPSPPPSTAVASARFAPLVCGNGNQPSSEERFLLVETPSITTGPSRPAAPSRPCRSRPGRPSCPRPSGPGAEEARLERVGLEERGQVRARLAEARRAEADRGLDGRLDGGGRALTHREVLPPERVRPAVLAADARSARRRAALSLASSDSSWAMVVGGDVMPALANRSLRYQKPTTCRSKGTPYCWPVDLPAGRGRPSSPIQLDAVAR